MNNKQRIATVLKNVASAAMSRGVNLAVAAAMVPLTVGSLTTGDYSILAVALSLSILASYADFGLGYAIVNKVATSKSDQQEKKTQRIISTIWFALIGIAIAGIAVAVAICLGFIYCIDSYFALPISVAVISILAGLPTGVAQRILFAQQRGGMASAMASASRIASLAWVYVAQVTGQMTLLNCIVGILSLPTVLNWAYTAYLFSVDERMRKYRPQFRNFEHRLFPSLLANGGRFLILQIVPYLESGADTVLLAAIIGMEIVPAWDVHSRLFGYIPAITLLAIFPLWPAVSKAASEHDYQWISKMRKIALLGTPLITGVLAYVIAVNSEEIIDKWTGKALPVDGEIVASMALLTTVACTAIAQSSILNGLNKIKMQAQINSVYIVVLVPIKLVALFAIGPVAMLLAATALYMIRILVTEFKYGALLK